MWRSMTRTSAAAILVTVLSTFCSALEVAPDSPCSSKCIDRNDGNPSWRNQSLTFNDMLPCYNWEYLETNSTAAALKFRTCQECLMTSGYRTTFTDGDIQYTEQDSTWFLFNNKGVVDFCVFGRFAEEKNSNISSSSIYQRCNEGCSKIRSSIDYNIKSDPGGFDFCEHNTSANFTVDAESCATCLYQYDDLTILGNVLTTVQDMCVKKPGKNYTVPSNVSVYAAERIQLSSTSTSLLPTSSASPPLTAASSSRLSKGAIAGVVLGGLVAIIAVLGLILLLLKRRKNKVKASDVHNNDGDALPPGYRYTAVQAADKDRYGYAAEAPTNQVPVEMGNGREMGELPIASTPPAAR
ncbi:lpxtg-domain-containing protein [Stagonosporopsis vannaccii]|nr:lpxtg-domain-containing protein [Stagonosporopsis vannaccii]